MRAGALAAQPVEEQVRQGEVPEVVDPEGRLEPVGGRGPARHDQAGVVDQHVEAVVAIEERGRERPDRGEVREVERQEVDVGAPAALTDVATCSGAAAGITARS